MSSPIALPNPGWSRDYRLIEPVGSGSAGVVWRAELRCAAAFTRTIALKVLDEGVVQLRIDRLRHEARLLGQLRHRAIVSVLGLVEVGGRTALAMEFVPGADLGRLLTAGPMPPATAIELAGEIAGALDAAWTTPDESGRALQLVHRNLSTNNVRITPHGAVKVLDFGLARTMDTLGEGTRALPRCPESLQGQDGPAADVYALGLLLFEALTGRPFGPPALHQNDHDARSREALMSLWEMTGSDTLVRLVSELLAWDPAYRPTARDVERRCSSLRRKLAGPPMRDWAELAIAALGDASSGRAELYTSTRPPVPRRPQNTAAVLLCIVSLIGMVGAATGALMLFALLS